MTDVPLRPDRDAFDLPRDVVWMNCAQMSAMHRSVADAGRRGVDRKRRPWETPPARFFDEVERARSLFADLAQCDADGVALTPSASYGLAVAARNLPARAGQTILLVERQFPSNVYAWRRLAAETGAEIVTVRRAPDGAVTEPLLQAIDERTAIVACGGVHWSDGTPIDLTAVSRRAKSVGAAFVVDLCQALGATDLDLGAIAPDFAAAPMYKWMLGPYASAFLYVDAKWRDGRPLEESWVNRANAEDFAGLVDYTDAYAPGARRFDMGEKAKFHTLPMTVAALELLCAWRPARIAAALQAVNDRLAGALEMRGFDVPARALRSPHYFGVGLPPGAPDDLAARLAASNVFASVRGGRLRIAPHLWIDAEDEARFVAAIDAALDRAAN